MKKRALLFYSGWLRLFLLLLTFGTGFAEVFAQCGAAASVQPSTGLSAVCAGNGVYLYAPGLSVSKWVYRDNGTGPWINTFSSGNPATVFTSTVSSLTTREYRAVVAASGSCAEDTSLAVSVTVKPTANGNVGSMKPSVSAASTCAYNTVNLWFTPFNGTVDRWIYRDNASSGWNILAYGGNNTSTSYNGSTSVTRTVRAIVRLYNGCSLDTTTGVDIQFNPRSAGNQKGLAPYPVNAAICAGSLSQVNFTPPVGTVAGWLYRDGNSGSWTLYSSTSTSYYDYSTSVSSNTTRYYRVLVLNPRACTIDTTDAAAVSIGVAGSRNNPGIVPTTSTAAVCSGTLARADISYSSFSGSVIKWQYSDNGGVWKDISSSATNSLYDYATTVTVATTRRYRAVINNSNVSCTIDTTASVTVLISPVASGNTTLVQPYTQYPEVCAGNVIQVNVPSGNSVLNWIYRDNNMGVWNNLFTSSVSYNDYNTRLNVYTQRAYRAVLNNTLTCTRDTTPELVVAIQPVSAGSRVAIYPQANVNGVCAGSSVSLNVSSMNTTYKGVVSWIYSDNGGPWNVFNYSDNTYYTDYATNVTSATRRSYRALIRDNETCKIDTSEGVSVNLSPMKRGTVAVNPTTTLGEVCRSVNYTLNLILPSGYTLNNWIYRDSGTTYWSYASSSLPYTTNVFANARTVRTYRAILYDASQCKYDTTAGVSVIIKPLLPANNTTLVPNAITGSVCSGNTAQLSVNLPAGASINNWIYRDGTSGSWNTIFSSSSTLNHSQTTVAASVSRYYKAVISNPNNCSLDTSAAALVSISGFTSGNKITNAPTAGSAAICGGATAYVSLSGISGAYSVQRWQYTDNGASWYDISGYNGYTYVNDNNTYVSTPVSRKYRAILTRTGTCTVDTTSEVTVVISPVTNGNIPSLAPATSTGSICSGFSPNIYLSSLPGGASVQRWIYRNGNAGDWMEFDNFTSTTSISDPNTFTSSVITRSYRAIIQQTASCSYDTTAMLTITINPVTAGNAPGTTITNYVSSSLCSGAYVNFYVAGTVRHWLYRDNNGPWIVAAGGVNTLYNNNTQVSALVSREYRAILMNASTCTEDTTAPLYVNLSPLSYGSNLSVKPIAGSSVVCQSAGYSYVYFSSLPSGSSVIRWIYKDNSGPWQNFTFNTASSSLYDYNIGVSSSTSRSYRAIISTSTCSQDTTGEIVVTLSPYLAGNLPTVSPTSASATACFNTSVTVSVSNPSGYSVSKWLVSNNGSAWKPFSTSTSTSITDNNTAVAATTVRSYAAVLINTSLCKADTTAPFTLTIYPRGVAYGNNSTKPTVTNASICQGQTASLNISTSLPVVRWIYNDSGSTVWNNAMNAVSTSVSHSNTYVVNRTKRTYRAVLQNNTACRLDTSDGVEVVIKPLTPGQDLTIKPLSSLDTVCIGATASPYVNLPSGASVIRWIYADSTNALGSWNVINSSANAYLYDNNTNVNTITTRLYRAIILKSSCNADTTDTRRIVLKGRSNQYVPSRTITVYNATVCYGNTVQLYTGGTIVKWLYRDDSTQAFTPVSSTNNTFYDYNTYLSSAVRREYRAIVSGTGCTYDSTASAYVNINTYSRGNATTVTPTVTNSTVCYGGTITVSVVPGSGNTTYSWLYQDSGTTGWNTLYNYGNYTNDYNTYSGATRYYRAILLRGCSYDTTNAVKVTIKKLTYGNAAVTPTTLTPTVCTGTPVTVTISPGAGYSVTKWMFSTGSSGVWYDFSYGSATSVTDNYTFSGVSTVRKYRALLYNANNCSYDTSADLSVTINPVTLGNTSVAPTSTLGTSACTGTSIPLSISAGSGNTVLKWMFRNSSGAWMDLGYYNSNTATDYYTSVSSTITRDYAALIYIPSTCHIDTSAVLSMSISPRTYGNDNSITPTSSLTSICSGDYPSISVSPGSGNSVLKWVFRDGTGAWKDFGYASNSITDYATSVSSTTTRAYRALIVKGSSCTYDTSAAFNLTINPLVRGNDAAIIPTTGSSAVCTGTSVSLSVTPGSGNTVLNWLYRDGSGSWFSMGASGSSAIDYNTYVSSSTSRQYAAIIKKSSGCRLDTSASLAVTISPRAAGNDNTITPLASSTSICSGQDVTISVALGSGNSVYKWIYRNNSGSWTQLGYYGTSFTDYATTVSGTSTREYRALITKGSGCTIDTSAAVSVTINPRLNGNDNSLTPTVTNSTVCSGTAVTLNLSLSSGTGYIQNWIYRDGNGSWTNLYYGYSTSAYDYNTVVSTATTRSYRALVVKTGSCTIDTTAAVNVTINPVSAGTVAITPLSSNSSLCYSNYANISINPGSGSVVQWIYRDGTSGSWNYFYGGGRYISDYNGSPASNFVRFYRAIIYNATTCSNDTSNAVAVTFSPLQYGNSSVTPGVSQTSVCSGLPVNVFVNPGSGVSVNGWLYRDGNGSWNVWGTYGSSIWDYNTSISSVTTRQYRALLFNTTTCHIDTTNAVSVTLNTISVGNDNATVPATSTPQVCSGSGANLQLTAFSGLVQKWIYQDAGSSFWTAISNSNSAYIYDYNTNTSVSKTRQYRCIYLNTTTCSYDTTAALTLTINPPTNGNIDWIRPVASDTTICSGTNVNISLTSFVGYVQKWVYRDNQSGSWTDIAGTSYVLSHVPNVSADVNREYRAIVFSGCSYDTTAARNVSIDAAPATPAIEVWGDSLRSTVTGASYSWTLNGAPLGGANGRSIKPDQHGDYAVTVYSTNGCSATSPLMNYTGVTEKFVSRLSMQVYPNPAVDRMITVAVQGANHAEVKVQVYNTLGQLVLQTAFDSAAGHVQLNLDGFAAGLYQVKVVAGEGIGVSQVILP